MTDAIEAKISGFFNDDSNNSYTIDDLNEICASLSSEVLADEIWLKLMDGCRRLVDPTRRADISIAIFDLLVESPVYPLWLIKLPEILADKSLWWILFSAYSDAKGELFDHMKLVK